MPQHFEAVFVRIPIGVLTNTELHDGELHQLGDLTRIRILDSKREKFRSDIVAMTSNVIRGKLV
jgi:hypothetical protein